MNIEEIKLLRESEDKVEFKEAKAQYNYNNGRRSVLGYVVALANEGGGKLILGIKENKAGPPHTICGSKAFEGREGKLEQDVYRDMGTRIQTEVLFEGTKRVLVIHIKSRPIGQWLTFEDVPLMRVGEELLPMSSEQMRSILLEQEGDFSAKPCPGLSMADLDNRALQLLKEKYADKQNNQRFLGQSDKQVLIDLDLLRDHQLTYAALILLGKKEKIKELLPQCEVRLEYRTNTSDIAFDKRNTFVDPYFLLIDEIWKIIDARNKTRKIQLDSYIIDIPELNSEVIRESINNAVAHRDYTKASEIVIKQSPEVFTVTSHGGLPLGVTKENILTVNSTPRNRLLAEVMTKTGLVERSGQGVDKIYLNTLSEGKAFPAYDDTDMHQVTVKVPVQIKFPVFALFVSSIQKKLSAKERLGVHHLITMVKIRDGEELSARDKDDLPKLIDAGALNEKGDSFSPLYTSLVEQLEGSDRDKIVEFVFVKEDPVKMGDILELFKHRLNRRQVNNIVYKLVEEGILTADGKGSARTYSIN
ncbi:MAG: putative DNA binding domain-containing protein [Bacteroidia bacterium]